MARFEFDSKTHQYIVDGCPVPSVTQVLKAAGLIDYAGIPQAVLDYAAERGTAVHLATQLYDENDLDRDSLDPLIAPYLSAWINFTVDHPIKILCSEGIALGKIGDLAFGMTVDRLVHFPRSRQDVILDIKCTSRIHNHHGIQLAGYACGLASGGFLRTRGDGTDLPDTAGPLAKRLEKYRRIVVQLQPDATYNLHEFSDPADGEVFAAALRIAHWKMGV
jgi:hypothetical protein